MTALKETQEPVESKTEDIAPDPMLVHILTCRRSYGSSGDITFRTWLFEEIKKLKCTVNIHTLGNIVANVGGKKSTTLFSCHTDTVHSLNESNTKQDLLYDADFTHIFLKDKQTSTCLGADDGAGVYLMLKMIQAEVPGTYIFHVGEEKGGIGARGMLDKEPKFFDKFDRSIAFDRAGINEVICTQGGKSCASLAFGGQLATALTKAGLPHEISHRGTFTDNRVYADVIPENVNLAVGYYNQHGKEEYLDYGHLESLVKVCLSLEWEKLKVVRECPPPLPAQPPQIGNRYRSWMDDIPQKTVPKFEQKKVDIASWQELLLMSSVEIQDLVDQEPAVAHEAVIGLIMQYESEKARRVAAERLLAT